MLEWMKLYWQRKGEEGGGRRDGEVSEVKEGERTGEDSYKQCTGRLPPGQLEHQCATSANAHARPAPNISALKPSANAQRQRQCPAPAPTPVLRRQVMRKVIRKRQVMRKRKWKRGTFRKRKRKRLQKERQMRSQCQYCCRVDQTQHPPSLKPVLEENKHQGQACAARREA